MIRISLLTALLGAIVLTGLALVAPPATAAGGDEPHKVTLWKDGDAGDRLVVSGRVVDSNQRPIAGAQIFVRQADGGGDYSGAYSATLISAADGQYMLRTAVPGQYSSAKHIHINVTHNDYQPLYTEIRFKGDPNADASGDPSEIALEEATHAGKIVFVGKFDIVLRR